MRSSSRLALAFSTLALGSLASLGGCGGAPPPAPAAPAPVSSAPVVVAAPEPDRSEVPEPAGTVVIARWKSPAASFAAIRAWAPLPLSLTDVLAAVTEDPSTVGLVAADASVDAAVTLDPASAERDFRPFAAVSFGVTSFDDARRALERRGPVREVRPGFARFAWKRDRLRAACALVASAGSTPGRIVCGDRERDVDALAPFLARTLPRREPPKSDVHAELRLSAIDDRYGALLEQSIRLGASVAPSQLQVGQPELDRAIVDAVQGVAEEVTSLAKDVGTLSIDVAFGADDATTETTFAFRGKTSWSAQQIADSASRVGPPPPLFWHLPADASFASYGHGADPKRFEGIAHTLRELVGGGAAYVGLSAADRKALTELVSTRWVIDGAAVSASGSLDAKTFASLARPDAAAGGKPRAKRPELAGAEKRALAQVAGFGWSLYGVDEPAARSIEAWKRLADAYARPSVQASLKKGLTKLDPSFAAALPKVKVSSQAVGLPKGTLELELSMTTEALVPAGADDFDENGKRKAAAKSKPGDHPTLRFWVFVMPDGASTWTALGADRSTLVNHLLAAKSDAPPAGTLAKRDGLDELRASTRAGSGGFLSLGGIVRQMRGGLAHEAPKVDVDRLLSAAPHHGETPMVMTSTASPEGPVWSAKLRVPRAIADDVVGIVAAAALATH